MSISEAHTKDLLKRARWGINRLLRNWDEILPKNRKRLAGGIMGDADMAYRILIELNARAKVAVEEGQATATEAEGSCSTRPAENTSQ